MCFQIRIDICGTKVNKTIDNYDNSYAASGEGGGVPPLFLTQERFFLKLHIND